MAPRNTMPSVKGIDALKAAFNRFIALSLMPAQMIELKNTQLFADGLRLHRGLLRAIEQHMRAFGAQQNALEQKIFSWVEKCDQTDRTWSWSQSDAIALRGGIFVTSASCGAQLCHQ